MWFNDILAMWYSLDVGHLFQEVYSDILWKLNWRIKQKLEIQREVKKNEGLIKYVLTISSFEKDNNAWVQKIREELKLVSFFQDSWLEIFDAK